jgi:hypothetical protein
VFTGVVVALGREEAWLKWLATVLDVLVYVFLPLWTTILIRVIQVRLRFEVVRCADGRVRTPTHICHPPMG